MFWDPARGAMQAGLTGARISLTWKLVADGAAVREWADERAGPPPSVDSRAAARR